MGMASQSQSALADPAVLDIAGRTGATPAQVLLGWGMQRGTSVIVKSSSDAHLRENLGAGELVLSELDMAAVSELNRNLRFNDPGQFCEAAFDTFCPIFD